MDLKDYSIKKENQFARPHNLTLEALQQVSHFKSALDIGCGNFKDSIPLLEAGFEKVVGVDKRFYTTPPNDDRFSFIQSTIESFPFGKYDYIGAMYAISNLKDTKKLIKKIYNSLTHEGIFAGQVFDTRDSWCSKDGITCFSATKIRALLKEFKIIALKECAYRHLTMSGEEKDWRIIEFVVKKPQH